MTQNPPFIPKISWQQELAEAFTTIDALCAFLELDPKNLPISEQAAKQFALKVPKSFAENMHKNDPNDPLLLQILPTHDETLAYPGFNDDPVGDLMATRENHILHKYQGRVLMINTGTCAINCRYCFRRNFPYADYQLGRQKQNRAIEYIANDPSITEVILSGGDPLLLSDSRLAELIEQLNAIEHLTRIRIHSRIPIVLPSRITDELIKTLNTARSSVTIVMHCNHANEISHAVETASRKLKHAGIMLFNQAVLLKNINDNAEQLCRLSETLFRNGIVPYYLHCLDKATGTGHFEVSNAETLALYETLQKRLPGYLVPKLVREVAGAPYKKPIEASERVL
ncbi:MAG: EF-P beta-lysylation protein EpmB [Methylomicrobium sp.]|nr:EF-P beta-lysylation protein EpmB [Methylomicrobium sp.]